MKDKRVFFVSGHRDITEKEFEDNYKFYIMQALIRFDAHFVIGDYYGVDIMAQNFIADVMNRPDTVTVYHMLVNPRNINPKIKSIIGGFKTDEERDAAMTYDSDEDIAFVRKGRWESGTAQNIKRRHTLKK